MAILEIRKDLIKLHGELLNTLESYFPQMEEFKHIDPELNGYNVYKTGIPIDNTVITVTMTRGMAGELMIKDVTW